jgi:hypothetical protein
MYRYSSVIRARFHHNVVFNDKTPSSRLASSSLSSSSSSGAGLDSPQQMYIPPISSHLMIELDDPEVVVELSQLDDPEVVVSGQGFRSKRSQRFS